jgi:hypothetical protein
MRLRNFKVAAAATALAALVALALAGCGGVATGAGTAATARSLLKQTFTGVHKVDSGVLVVSIKVKVNGSRTITKPLSLSLDGPFQTRGAHALPASDFSVSLSGQGRSGALQIISTGTAGYVAVGGTAYQLPTATYQKLESSFSELGGSGTSAASGGSALSKLGIDPLGWLKSPEVVASGTVGGASAIDVSAGIDMSNLLTGLATVLDRASAAGITKLPSTSSLATLAEFASKITKPSVNLWTGSSDHTLRRLTLSLEIPLSGEVAELTGNASSATLALTLGYSNINQPETVATPTVVQPYSQFLTKFKDLVESVESEIASSALENQGSGGTGSTTTTTNSPSNTYNSCMTAAGNNVAAMQQCVAKYGG